MNHQEKKPQKVFLGVSGGIDSFASALLLKEQGYDVTGVHLVMESDQHIDTAFLSERLNMPIISYSAVNIFYEHVYEHFINTYLHGGVPSPCVECNRYVKWQCLKDVADQEGGGLIATGHYANTVVEDGVYFISKGVDPLKDQSYYLWKLEQDILKRAIFPLGNLTKEEVRSYVYQNGYTEQLEKKESMGLCFFQGKSLREFLTLNRPALSKLYGGEIIDRDGVALGTHYGYPFYTLAQKKGLNLPKGYCIVKVDKENNRLIAGSKEELYSNIIHAGNIHITSKDRLLSSSNLTVKVRGVGVNPEGIARVILHENSHATISLSNPAWAVTKGQPVVFYDDDIVLGGGYVINP